MIIIEGDWLKLQCENPGIERFRGILRESSCCDGARKDKALGLGFVEQRETKLDYEDCLGIFS